MAIFSPNRLYNGGKEEFGEQAQVHDSNEPEQASPKNETPSQHRLWRPSQSKIQSSSLTGTQHTQFICCIHYLITHVTVRLRERVFSKALSTFPHQTMLSPILNLTLPLNHSRKRKLPSKATRVPSHRQTPHATPPYSTILLGNHLADVSALLLMPK